ncbi:DUF4294 domain-containing protein [Psychroflexus aurantiacus]|nr:DUF4294 domain-containing protein [Psychroflexus aurantiacus]
MKITAYFCLLLSLSLGAQEYKYKRNSEDSIPRQKKFMILDKDSAWVDEVKLDEVIILPKLNFKNRDEFRDYLILKRKTKKVWPYARLASERFEILNQRLENIKSKRKKRKYTLIIQKYVEEEFTEELKKLTKTEGQILVKLIHRQTGETTFDLVKDLRSGWRAFWYNTTASFFNISLKEEYQPSTVKEDFYIEDILQREFQSGSLNKQAPKTDIQFLELMDKWQKDSLLLPPSARRSFGRY